MKMRKHRWLIGILGAGLLLAAAGSAAAITAANTGSGSSQTAGDPTERDSQRKAEEAGRPLPTALAPTATCPADASVCDFGSVVARAVATGSLQNLSRSYVIDCPSKSSPALSPLCDGGGRQAGLFTGVFGRVFRFVDPVAFRQFVVDASGANRASARLVTVGCPALGSELDCKSFAAYAVGTDDPDTAIVVLATRDADGSLHVIGARSWSTTALEFLGGDLAFEQDMLPYKGPMRFVPVSIK